MLQTDWHKKEKGALICDVCGCDNVRAGVPHKALTAEESWKWGALWIKQVKVDFGRDWDHKPIKPKA